MFKLLEHIRINQSKHFNLYKLHKHAENFKTMQQIVT